MSGSSMTLSLISASISSVEMSSDANFDFWLISTSVLVRSTSVRRPSEADKSKMERCGRCLVGDPRGESGDEVGGEKEGIWGARMDIVGLL